MSLCLPVCRSVEALVGNVCIMTTMTSSSHTHLQGSEKWDDDTVVPVSTNTNPGILRTSVSQGGSTKWLLHRRRVLPDGVSDPWRDSRIFSSISFYSSNRTWKPPKTTTTLRSCTKREGEEYHMILIDPYRAPLPPSLSLQGKKRIRENLITFF